MIATFVDKLFEVLRVFAKERYKTDAVSLYDGRFDGLEPETVKVSKLMFFLDMQGVELVTPKVNDDEIDVPEIIVNANILVANRTIVFPSKEEPFIADVLLSLIFYLKRQSFDGVRLLKIGNIENAVKTENYSVMRLSGLEFILNTRHI